ncbi:MAG TPA: type IV toxin-antitoxin system AbiEi family antitoxin domain-containing protein [Streptosporangiaceae bacterium]
MEALPSSGRDAQTPAVRAQVWSAECQDGVISRAQALALGLTRNTIAWRLERGLWQRMLPGVYATFSGEPGRRCRLWAVTLQAGPGSALSHHTAAELWGLTSEPSAAVHITVPRGSPVARLPGVVLHYSGRVLAARHPVLTPSRTRIEETVLDLAQAAVTLDEALAWIFRSCAERRTTPEHLAQAMRLRPRLRWRAELSRALGEAISGVHSLLEHRYFTGVERPHGLPAGKRQLIIRRGSRRQYSDVAYEEYSTLVELDGRVAHPEASRWTDIRRDNANAADGRVTLRYGWTEVCENSCEVAAEVARALRQRGWTGSPRRCGTRCRMDA